MTRVPRLSPRLQAVARQTPPGARLADVGTDHAHLPVWLLREGHIAQAIASDIRQGPLERGQTVARLHGVEDRISFRLCSGLEGIAPGEADVVVLAGMGGETIAAILAAAPWVQTESVILLLQPMSGLPELRVWLQKSGFMVEREEIVPEGRRFYVVMTVRAGLAKPLTLGETWAGCQATTKMAGPRSAYLAELLRRRQQVALGQAKGILSPEERTREESLTAELEQIKEEWDAWQQ